MKQLTQSSPSTETDTFHGITSRWQTMSSSAQRPTKRLDSNSVLSRRLIKSRIMSLTVTCLTVATVIRHQSTTQFCNIRNSTFTRNGHIRNPSVVLDPAQETLRHHRFHATVHQITARCQADRVRSLGTIYWHIATRPSCDRRSPIRGLLVDPTTSHRDITRQMSVTEATAQRAALRLRRQVAHRQRLSQRRTALQMTGSAPTARISASRRAALRTPVSAPAARISAPCGASYTS